MVVQILEESRALKYFVWSRDYFVLGKSDGLMLLKQLGGPRRGVFSPFSVNFTLPARSGDERHPSTGVRIRLGTPLRNRALHSTCGVGLSKSPFPFFVAMPVLCRCCKHAAKALAERIGGFVDLNDVERRHQTRIALDGARQAGALSRSTTRSRPTTSVRSSPRPCPARSGRSPTPSASDERRRGAGAARPAARGRRRNRFCWRCSIGGSASSSRRGDRLAAGERLRGRRQGDGDRQRIPGADAARSGQGCGRRPS